MNLQLHHVLSDITGVSGMAILDAYRFYQRLMAEADQEVELRMQELPRAEGAPEKRPLGTKKRIYQRAGNEPTFDPKAELFRIAGVDLTDVPGISTLTAHTILVEVGAEVSRFRNGSAFASWLGLCPEKQVSGGKVLYTRTRKIKNRAAIALRLGHTVCITLKTISVSFIER
jgi:transposase